MFKVNKIKSSLLALAVVCGVHLNQPVRSMTPDLGDENCESLLLVSSWDRNNVKIYDGCSGEFIQDLDSEGLINGPLGILQAPNGDVLVVSEENDSLLRFDFATLSQGSVVMNGHPNSATAGNFIDAPSGAVIAEDGFMYAASFGTNKVVKIDTESWEIVDEMLPTNNGLIRGIDAGLHIGPDGFLYLPGFSTHNIVKLDLQTKVASVVVNASAGGLAGTRTILIRGQELIATSEQSDAILVFDKDTGEFIEIRNEFNGPTGMMADGDDHFIMNNSTSVFRISNDGSSVETIVQPRAGGLLGGTFVYRLKKQGLDDDGDGLTNEDEINLHGTDPQNSDTDSDTLSDGDEINTYFTNPLLADSDNDGMPDDYEIANSLEANVDDAASDLDMDGLTNLDEYLAGTLANNDDTDGDGEKDGVDENPLVPNSAPEINGSPETSIAQDGLYNFAPNISYAGNIDTVSLSISNKPDWASFNQVNGELSGTPGNSDVGVTADVTISATNGFHIVNLDSFNLEVINVNDPPELLTNPVVQNITIGDNINVNIAGNFTDIDTNDILTFTATNLPAGLSISEQGQITGSPSSVGNSTAVITVTDTSGASVDANLVINVKDIPEESSSGGSFGWILLATLLLGIRQRRRFK